MDSTLMGTVLSVIGVLLSIWSIWYAWRQSQLMQGIQRNEMISLWAHLDRIRALITEISRITRDDNFRETGTLTASQVQILPGIHKGLADEYVRTAELIVKKTPDVSLEAVEHWAELGKLKTDWQKQQFMNLIATQVAERNERQS